MRLPKLHRRHGVLLALALCALAPSPALAVTNEDIAAAMGMLWRVRDGLCPGLAFDPKAFVTLIPPAGLTPEAVRKQYAEGFDQGYAVAGEWLAEGGREEYCQAVRQLFDGKTDFFGNPKTTPEGPIKGLTIKD
jgi:hypothetical protein